MTNNEKLELLTRTRKMVKEREHHKTALHLIDSEPLERKTTLEQGQTVIAPGITLTNDGGASVTFKRIGNLFEVSHA